MGVKGKMKAIAVDESETSSDVLISMRRLMLKGMSADITDKLSSEISDYKLAIESNNGDQIRALADEERPTALVCGEVSYYIFLIW